MTLALFCLAIVAASLIGGAVPMAASATHRRLQVYLSLAAGTMLGAAFFHMLPEAVEGGGPGVLNWAVAGLLGLFLLERFFAFHDHEIPTPDDEHDGHHHHHAEPENPLRWQTAAFGMTIHTLSGGIALASAVYAEGMPGSTKAGAWSVFIATLLHKPADALTIVSLMRRSGASKGLTHAVNLGFAAMIPIGAALFTLGVGLAGQSRMGRITADALAFSAGTFLCIALSDLLPELHFHDHDRIPLSIALLAGVALMATAGFWG